MSAKGSTILHHRFFIKSTRQFLVVLYLSLTAYNHCLPSIVFAHYKLDLSYPSGLNQLHRRLFRRASIVVIKTSLMKRIVNWLIWYWRGSSPSKFLINISTWEYYGIEGCPGHLSIEFSHTALTQLIWTERMRSFLICMGLHYQSCGAFEEGIGDLSCVYSSLNLMKQRYAQNQWNDGKLERWASSSVFSATVAPLSFN